MHQLAEEIKAIWSIGLLFRTIFYAILIGIADYLFFSEFTKWFLPSYIPSVIVIIIGIISIIIWPKLYYNSWKFDIRENEIYLERGVLTKVHTTAPFKRIQHIDVEQSVFDRMFGLGKLVIYTAGTRGADLLIPGLPIQYAEDLRDALKNIANEDAV